MNRRQWLHLSGLSLAGCRKQAQPSAPATTVEPPLEAGPFSARVPREWLEEVIVEKVPLKPLYSEAEWKLRLSDPQFANKPSYENRPDHWALRFPAAEPRGLTMDRDNAGDDPTAPQILIHKAVDWPLAFTDGKQPEPGSMNTPERIRGRIDDAFKKDDPQLSPAFMDAALTFTSLKKRIEFDGGYGIRMLAQWTIEPQLLRRGELLYHFLGLSADSSCQIIASFPVLLPGLPTAESTEHLGRNLQKYDDFVRDFDAYCAEVSKWLEEQSKQTTPTLDVLDGVISSLVARTWS